MAAECPMPIQPRSRTGIFEPAARHVLHLGDLIDDLADGVENEVGEHEVDDRPRARHGRAARQSDEAAFANGRVAQSLGTVQIVQSSRRLEVAASFADPFAQHEDRGIRRHLLGEGFVRRLREGDLSRLVRACIAVGARPRGMCGSASNTCSVAVDAGSGHRAATRQTARGSATSGRPPTRSASKLLFGDSPNSVNSRCFEVPRSDIAVSTAPLPRAFGR